MKVDDTGIMVIGPAQPSYELRRVAVIDSMNDFTGAASSYSCRIIYLGL